ncbi:MAG: hypothetical protein CME65_13505 [Halobacteriovoraceae bacterium]|nr:hypothetical protein [Halobacteriovoraceae bacterium]|tara:strand:- start:11228 stop:12361 length:1134 start_codon:yes stop_codon:yes gene_type:complete
MNWTIEEFPIKELATGETLKLKTYTVKGSEGPHIHIQASVHGAELQGNAVILQLMDLINQTQIRGSITFIPLANPYATNNKHGTYTYGRYNPVTGHNWNRNFVDIINVSKFDLIGFVENNIHLPWHELKIVYKSELDQIFRNYFDKLIETRALSENNKLNLMLQHLASKADGILDLHTGPTATRYLYAAEYEAEVSHYLKFKYNLIIPNEYAGSMDESAFMPWVHLMNKLKAQGREIIPDIESFTLEFGSEETFRMDEAAKDVESIVNYLRYKGVLEGMPDKIDSHSCLLENYKTIFSPKGGLVDYHFEPGQKFNKGDTLASFYNLKNIDPNDPIESSRSAVKAEQDGIIINRCPSSSVHQGMELYQVMTKLSEHKV